MWKEINPSEQRIMSKSLQGSPEPGPKGHEHLRKQMKGEEQAFWQAELDTEKVLLRQTKSKAYPAKSLFSSYRIYMYPGSTGEFLSSSGAGPCLS